MAGPAASSSDSFQASTVPSAFQTSWVASFSAKLSPISWLKFTLETQALCTSTEKRSLKSSIWQIVVGPLGKTV